MDGLHLAAPILVVALTGVALLVVESFSSQESDRTVVPALTGMTGLLLAFFLTLGQWDTAGDLHFFARLGKADNYAVFLNLLFLVCTALTLLVSPSYLEKYRVARGEFYSLVFFAVTGMMIMASSTNLVVIFFGLEVMSVSSYVLSSYVRERVQSVEAGMKYFLIGAFATGILFYGIVLLYGASHPVGQWGGVLPTQGTPRSTFDLPELCRHLDAAMTKASGDVRRVPNHALLLAAVGLIIVGFGFKVASVPFHAWAPDVYEGAPTPVTAFMATAVKAAAFAALVRILITGLRPFFGQWCAVFVWLAVLTMFLGNLVALTQTNMKRMLAYSSIAHAGYLLIGICALDATSGSPVAAVLYYLLAYAFMNMGTFAIISFLETQEGRGLSLDEYSGLAGKHPYLCAAMSVFMLSLGGIPLTGGFMGKLFVFRAAIHADRTFLAVLGILNSLISLFYYLRVMIRMYMDKPAPVDEGERPPMPSVALAAAIAICVAGTLWLGFGPPVGLGIADLWNWAVLSQQSLAP